MLHWASGGYINGSLEIAWHEEKLYNNRFLQHVNTLLKSMQQFVNQGLCALTEAAGEVPWHLESSWDPIRWNSQDFLTWDPLRKMKGFFHYHVVTVTPQDLKSEATVSDLEWQRFMVKIFLPGGLLHTHTTSCWWNLHQSRSGLTAFRMCGVL